MVRISPASDGSVSINRVEGGLVQNYEEAFVYEDVTYHRYIIAQGSTIVAKLSFEEAIYTPYIEPPAAP